jgi:ubiquinone/menaquinone biosynthesis C-methylase UbiE
MTEIDMTTNEHIKALAVETHSRQADEFAHSYTVHDAYVDCFNYSRHRLDALLTKLIPPVDRPLALLDVGCGTGHHMQRYARLGYKPSGVDGSEEMLAHARVNNPGADLKRADVEALPFSDASFDVATAIEVLRYLPDPRRSIDEIGRVLKPGGRAIVTASPLLSLNFYPIVNRVANLVPMKDFVRLKQFFSTSGQLRSAFKDAGFTTVNIHGVYFGPVNWVERLMKKKTPGFLRRWEPIDRALADKPIARELSNMFLVEAVKG